jgi:hypothetical protein
MLARDLERRFDARVVSLHVDGSGARVELRISPLASPAEAAARRRARADYVERLTAARRSRCRDIGYAIRQRRAHVDAVRRRLRQLDDVMAGWREASRR